PRVDPRLAKIIDRAMLVDRAQRFPSGEEMCEALEEIQRAIVGRSVVAESNPYRGLRPFGTGDRGLFFGRDAEIEALIDRLRVSPFVLVAGDSGIGKSSLCRAGVVPALMDHAELGNRCRLITTTPMRAPLTAFTIALARAIGLDERKAEQNLRRSPAKF